MTDSPKLTELTTNLESLPRSSVIDRQVFATAIGTTHTTKVVTLQQSGADDLLLVIDFTKVGSAPSVVFTIQGVAFPNGPNAAPVVWKILDSAAVTATGVTLMKVSDSMAAVTNVVAQDILPDFFQVLCTHGSSPTGDACSYTITAIAAP